MNGDDIRMSVMADFMVVFFFAFAISFVATPLMRVLAIRTGIVDWPDLARKNHVGPVAYLGGLAVFLAWIGGLAICIGLITPAYADQIEDSKQVLNILLSIVFGAVCITMTGLIDDIYGVSPRVKIGGQFLAAGALAMSSQGLGTQLMFKTFDSIGLTIDPTLAYILGAALIGLFVIGGCNAMNLLDGLDGLACGVATICSIGFLVISVIASGDKVTATQIVRVVLCLSLLGALLGFLPYNFNPANIFLGDAGSLLIGFLCVSTILLFADKPHLVMAALVVFALPITDTALAIFRRKMRGQKIFSPDNQHIHHQLLRVISIRKFSVGMRVKVAVFAMYGLATIFAVLGCSLVYLRIRYAMAVFFPLFAFIVVSAYKVGQQQHLVSELKRMPDHPAPPPQAGEGDKPSVSAPEV